MLHIKDTPVSVISVFLGIILHNINRDLQKCYVCYVLMLAQLTQKAQREKMMAKLKEDKQRNFIAWQNFLDIHIMKNSCFSLEIFNEYFL